MATLGRGDGSNAPIPTLDGQALDPFGNNWGLTVNKDSSEVWIAQRDAHRIVRIRNPLTAPVIDVVLGQVTVSGTLPNRGSNIASPATLSHPGALRLDPWGNLFVADYSLESAGNFRLLAFARASIPSGVAMIYGPAATKVFPETWTGAIAFHPTNGRMVVGYNPYGQGNATLNVNGWRGYNPGVYDTPADPVVEARPVAFLMDFYSQAISADFDHAGNLYVADHNRCLVLRYNVPLGGVETPVPVPAPDPVPVPTPTPTPAPAPKPPKKKKWWQW